MTHEEISLDPTLAPPNSTRVSVPPLGSLVRVYHPHLGRIVKMEVVDRRGNHLECSYRGIEWTVRLAKVQNILNPGETFLRWEALRD